MTILNIEENLIENKFKKLNLRLLFGILMLVITASFILFSFHFKELEPNVFPEIDKKTKSVGMFLEKELERALKYGIPLDKFKGVEPFFKETLKDHKDILFLAISTPDGTILYRTDLKKEQTSAISALKHDESSLELASKTQKHEGFYHSAFLLNYQGKVAGILHIGTDTDYIASTLKDIFYDALTILVVSLIIAAEIIFFIVRINLSGPIENLISTAQDVRNKHISKFNVSFSKDEIGTILNGFNVLLVELSTKFKAVMKKVHSASKRFDLSADFQKIKQKAEVVKSSYTFNTENINSQSILDPRNIRTPIFLFLFCEMLPISFLSTYGSQFYEPIMNIPKDIVVSFPVIAFMFVFALFTPFSGYLSDVGGLKKTFLFGVTISGIGYIVTIFASSILELTLIRCVSAIGFALAFTSSQALLASSQPKDGKSDTSSTFLFAFASATLCGAPIGGILADNIGYGPTFLLSGVVSLILGLIIYRFISEPYNKKVFQSKNSLSNIKLLLKDKDFSRLLFLSGLPSRIMYGGLLFFLIPVYLVKLGTSQSVIGRVTMLYGLSLLIASPFLAKFLPRSSNPRRYVFIGSILMGLSCIAIILYTRIFKDTSIFSFVIAVSFLGIGHALQMGASMSLVFKMSNDHPSGLGKASIIGSYNSIERYGHVIGPVVAALLMSFYNIERALEVMSILTLVPSLWMLRGFYQGNKQ